jgi:hypothetical protein
VTFGIGSSDGVGRVIGGCPDAGGSSVGCGLVEMVDGPTGFELSLQAAVNSESPAARTIPQANRRNDASDVDIAEM